MASHLPHLTLKLALLDRGIDNFSIVYTKDPCVYLPGEKVRGHVSIECKEAIKAKTVTIHMIGKAYTSWTLWEQYSSNRSTHSEAIPYSATELYVDVQKTLWNGEDEEQVLNPGNHKLQFEFVLPKHCPPSFEGGAGFIRYYCKAKIERLWKFDETTRQGFTVVPHFDVNTTPYAMCPVLKAFERQVGAFCVHNGQLEAVVKLSKCGYVPGESIALTMDIANNSNKDVVRIETALIESANFTAHRGRMHHLHYGLGTRHSDVENKRETRVVVQYIEKFKVPRHSHSTYMRMLAIPPIVPSCNVCTIIQIDYIFKVKIVTKGYFNQSLTGETPIIIGTIPLRHTSSIQKAQTLTEDHLTPPHPRTFRDDDALSELSVTAAAHSFADSIFGKGTLIEAKDDKSVGFTPKYIFYHDCT